MTLPLAGVYLGALSGSLLVTWYLTPLAFAFARRRGLFGRGVHEPEAPVIPLLGGAAIVTGFAVSVLGVSLLAPIVGGRAELAVVLAAALALAGVGLVDDLRGLGPWIRLAAEVAAGVVVWSSSVGVDLYGPWQLDLALTVVWVVAVTNSLNLLDNMDGLSAGVATAAATAFFVVAALSGQFLVATLSLALAGCAAGFLRHNFHPARIYMGDAGSLFLGFMLAVIGIKLRFPETPRAVALFVPPMVLGVAIFDTTLVVVARLLHRRNPMSGGRDHVSHRLVFSGLSVRVSVAIIYAASAVCGWLALVLVYSDEIAGLLLVALVACVSVALGFALGAVPVYDTSRRRHLMLTLVAPHEPDPPDPRQASEAV